MHLKAIDIKERLLGPDDYEVALSVGHLASLYNYDMNKFQEAERLYMRSINIGEGTGWVWWWLWVFCVSCWLNLPPLRWTLPSVLLSVLSRPVAHTRLPVQSSPTDGRAYPAVLFAAQRNQEPVLALGSPLIEGTFSLRVNMGSDSIPKNTL